MDDGEAIMREQGLRRDGGMEDERTCGRWAFGAFGAFGELGNFGRRVDEGAWEASARGDVI